MQNAEISEKCKKSLEILTELVAKGVTNYNQQGIIKVGKATKSKPSLVMYYADKYHSLLQIVLDLRNQAEIDRAEIDGLKKAIASPAIDPIEINDTGLPTKTEWINADALALENMARLGMIPDHEIGDGFKPTQTESESLRQAVSFDLTPEFLASCSYPTHDRNGKKLETVR